jgi:hypothetical protein
MFAYMQAFKRYVSLKYKEIYNAALQDNKLLSINLNIAGHAWGTGRFQIPTTDVKTYFFLVISKWTSFNYILPENP